MKYILICLAALVICFGIGFVVSKLLWKHKKKWVISLSTLILGFVLMTGLSFGYMSVYYHADERAEKALEGSSNVTVTKVDGGFFFDGAGNESALIFCPGAKVECEAYAPLMLKLSECGVDCFLIDMPLNYAIFGKNYADKILLPHIQLRVLTKA